MEDRIFHQKDSDIYSILMDDEDGSRCLYYWYPKHSLVMGHKPDLSEESLEKIMDLAGYKEITVQSELLGTFEKFLPDLQLYADKLELERCLKK